jgi:type II secretory pathway pseudopilin PulG
MDHRVDQRGFSLVALLVAMTLLAGFIAYYMALNIQTSRSVFRSGLYTQLLVFTQARLESLKAEPYDNLLADTVIVETAWVDMGDDSLEVSVQTSIDDGLYGTSLRTVTIETQTAAPLGVGPVLVCIYVRKP